MVKLEGRSLVTKQAKLKKILKNLGIAATPAEIAYT
jgi:hypothetical protein